MSPRHQAWIRLATYIFGHPLNLVGHDVQTPRCLQLYTHGVRLVGVSNLTATNAFTTSRMQGQLDSSV